MEDNGVEPLLCAIEVRRNFCIASTWFRFHGNVGVVDRASHVGKPAHILESIDNMLRGINIYLAKNYAHQIKRQQLDRCTYEW